LHFLRLVHEVDQKATMMANTLADTVRDLRMRRFIVCSIVTDNSSNVGAALNPGRATSVQRVTGINVFGTQCLSDAGNLAVGNPLAFLETKQAIPCDLWPDMVGLRHELTNQS
jgi:hypothetical protein